ncbi:MAG: sodium:proton antiporter [Alphaproteobacteria bacterium]|nr:sodium:proton antiporter [Alphaproteobacteria bacterium]
MEAALDILSWLLLVAGGLFCVIGTIGMLRMPDMFTRLHAASIIDTLGMGFLILGMLLQAGFTFVAAKLIILAALVLLTTPVATHALAQAALHAGIRPKLSYDETGGHIAGEDASSNS